MKNNKGFSLVELLVTLAVFAIVLAQIGNLMINCSSVYRNGSMEVALQTEAQQIILQLEDLLVDCEGVSYNGTVSNCDITISANSTDDNAIYQIKYDPVKVAADGVNGYGNLNVTITDSTGTIDNLLLSEDVGSISLNMANYTTNDVVTIEITMQNEKYSYTTTKDVFLRNMPGSGRSTLSDITVTKGANALQVYRYSQMDPAELFADEIYSFKTDTTNKNKTFTYTFELSGEQGSNGLKPDALYDLKQNALTNEWTISCKSIMTQTIDKLGLTFPRSDDPVVSLDCYAIDNSTGTKYPVCTSEIYTPAVSLGLSSTNTTPNANAQADYGYAIAFPSTANSSTYQTIIPFEGLDVAGCTKVEYEFDVLHFTCGSYDLDSDFQYLTETSRKNKLKNNLTLDSSFYNASNVFKDTKYGYCFYSGSWSTGSTVNNPVSAKSSGIGRISWQEVKTKDNECYEYDATGTLSKVNKATEVNMKAICAANSAENGYWIDSILLETDLYGNSFIINTTRFTTESTPIAYYDMIRHGYLLRGRFYLYFEGISDPVVFDLYFAPNSSVSSDGSVTLLDSTYLSITNDILYQMIDVVEK